MLGAEAEVRAFIVLAIEVSGIANVPDIITITNYFILVLHSVSCIIQTGDVATHFELLFLRY